MTTIPQQQVAGSQPETIAELGAIGTAAVALAGLLGVAVCVFRAEPLPLFESLGLLALWCCGIILQLFAAIKTPDDEEDRQ
jgi:hypothetical protein